VKSWIILTALAALLTLHQPKDEVYVNPEDVIVVASPGAGAPPWAKSSVLMHDKWLYFLETPQQVRALRDN
jgi:hypothetical protein